MICDFGIRLKIGVLGMYIFIVRSQKSAENDKNNWPFLNQFLQVVGFQLKLLMSDLKFQRFTAIKNK